MQLEDLKEHRERKAAEAQAKSLERMRVAHGVAEQMRELLADPKWNIYAGRLEELRARAERQAVAAAQTLTDGTFLDPKEYGQLRMTLSTARALAAAYGHSVSLITELVKAGELPPDVGAEGKI